MLLLLSSLHAYGVQCDECVNCFYPTVNTFLGRDDTDLLYCIVLYCIALHCIALYCIVLHCIALHRSVGSAMGCVLGLIFFPGERRPLRAGSAAQ